MARAATLCVVLACLWGCASNAKLETTTRLSSEGYVVKRSNKGNDVVEVWVKETRTPARIVHVCLVPYDENRAYEWRFVLYVKDKQEWEYKSSPEASPVRNRQRGTVCMKSDPLPEGRITWHWWANWR